MLANIKQWENQLQDLYFKMPYLLGSFDDVALGLGLPRPGPLDQLLPHDPHRPPLIPTPLSASHLSARVRSRDLLCWLGVEGCGGAGVGGRDWWGDDGQWEEEGERERERRLKEGRMQEKEAVSKTKEEAQEAAGLRRATGPSQM